MSLTPRLLSWTWIPCTPDRGQTVSVTTLFLQFFLSSLASVRGQHCPERLCPAVGCWWCQLLWLPHLLVCFSLRECWQRKAYCLPAPKYTGETCLQAQIREERKQSAVSQASSYGCASRTGTCRDQTKGRNGLSFLDIAPALYTSVPRIGPVLT